MNKNHLLPALLFVLAACGGTASSSSAATSSASAPVDNTVYKLVGNQSNTGSWKVEDAPVLTRATGTNSFSITVDLYEDAAWKVSAGPALNSSALSPKNSSISVIDKGVTWTKDNQGAFVVPANGNTGTKDDGFDGLNFETLVHGSYTITFVSLPATARTLTITRNGNPIVPPPTTIDFYLVGNFTTPTWENGFVAANKFTETSTAGTYEKTLDLLIGNAFKIVRMLGTTATWLGVLDVNITLSPTSTPATIGGTGDFTVSVHGSYKVTVVNGGAKPAVTFNRLGDPIVPPPAPEVDPANWKIVGTMTTPGFTPSNNSLPLLPVSGVAGSYSIDLDLVLGSQFKVKTGDAWNTGRDLGFSAVTSVTTNLFSNVDGNINSLVSGKFRVTYAFASSAGTITIAPLGWIGYTNPTAAQTLVVAQGATSASISYVNQTPAKYDYNAQLRLTTPFDQTKEGVEFDFTGKAGDQYLFKVEGGGAASELMATATGDAQKLIVPVVQLNATQRAGLNLFLIFARTSGSTGTIVVRDWKYVDNVTPAAPEWRAEGGATAVMNGTAMTFTYTAGRTFFYDQNAQIAIVGFDGSKTSVDVTFTGVTGQNYIFKFEYPNHSHTLEYTFTATGSEQTVSIDLTKDKNNVAITEATRDSFNKFVVFSATPGDAGSITVKPWTYTA